MKEKEREKATSLSTRNFRVAGNGAAGGSFGRRPCARAEGTGCAQVRKGGKRRGRVSALALKRRGGRGKQRPGQWPSMAVAGAGDFDSKSRERE
jgi:hypothetical protein